MELDFDKYCVVDGSPTTVLPLPRNPSKAADRKPSCRRSKNSQDFREFSFNRYHRSASCRGDVRSKRSNAGSNQSPELLKRGSEYLSSKEVTFLRNKNFHDVSERKKIEFSRDTVPKISLMIIDSLCSFDGNSSAADQSERSSTSSSCNKDQIEFLSKSAKSVKCKSRRSPLSSSIAREDIACKSSKNDVLEKPCSVEAIESRCETVKKPFLDAEISPAHLNGFLKVVDDSKKGVPSFEFSVDSPYEAYVAKTWKVENGLTRVYTFHSPHRRRSSKGSPVLGQMNVSCRLCPEVNGGCGGALQDKMVTEFVLYDTVHSSRKSTFSSEDNSPEIKKAPCKKHSCEKDIHRLSNSQPLPSVELHPAQEIAAIVAEFSLEKRESLKFKAGDKKTDLPLPSLLELCQIEKAREESSGAVHVVVPAGNHGSPSGGTRGPSPLLERWRSGGGCDCGGWDMACPLNILKNSNFSIPPTEDRIPVEIFPLGKKDYLPAFAMRCIEEGKYAVSFHGQLSSLQAFSICVAILHSAEATAFVGHHHGRSKRSDSLGILFPEEEIKNMIDDDDEALWEEEDSKSHKGKGQSLPQSFVVNPPFSPIARV